MERHLGRKLKRSEVVHHKDHDKTNYRLSNLQVMTRGQHNRLHNIGRPSKVMGIKNGNAKLTERQVHAIRRARGKYRDIAKLYRVTFGMIGHIKSRRAWFHI